MAFLNYPDADEVELQLGPNEDAILTVVRHCEWWTRAKVEGQEPGNPTVVGVTLVAERERDTTIREILLRSFQISFPADGGQGVQAESKVVARAHRPIH